MLNRKTVAALATIAAVSGGVTDEVTSSHTAPQAARAAAAPAQVEPWSLGALVHVGLLSSPCSALPGLAETTGAAARR